jgi:threonine synthase
VTKAWRGVIEEYRDRLPVTADTPVITLLEGGTPLLPAPRLSQLTGCDVYLKVEGANPTGSFKDRGMTLAISRAAEEGAKAVICASTGNTAAAAAAYAVRAGKVCAVLVPQGKIAMASWRRHSCTAPGSCRSTATSTTASSSHASFPPTTRSPWSTR